MDLLDLKMSRQRAVYKCGGCRNALLRNLFFAVLLTAYPAAKAATITASSLTAAAFQAAINLAQAGDTIVLPAGSANWTQGVIWNAPPNVTLKGGGTTATGGGDVTTIIDGFNSGSPLLALTIAATGTFRMTGFTLQTSALSPGKQNGMIVITGPGSARVDHVHFDNHTIPGNVKPMWIGDRVFGVVDHCIMDFDGNSAMYVANGPGPDGMGNTTWATATGFGGPDFIFFEDNLYRATVASPTRIADVFSAGRTVWRFNTINGGSGLEVHATGHAGDDRGARASEGYGNNFTALAGQVNPPYDMADISSGPMLVWGNAADPESLKNIFVFNVTRKNNDTYNVAATPNGFGYAGTAFNGTGSNWDGNANVSTGYPCLDQPGRGAGDLLVGSFPMKVNSITGLISTANQAPEPVYFWRNTGLTPHTGYGGAVYVDNSGGRVIANRDYYPQASGIQISPTSPFNGTSGTGWGTLANRPTTCTTGVAYWATDQGSWNNSTTNPHGVQQNGANGVLYKATATNTWTLYYTPYTYPHPLQRPSAPSNLRIN
jgi:hypothetical protein